MLPGINPRQMQGMLNKLGIKQEDIEAEEVIIKTKDKNIIINNPQVSIINMNGNKSFQITGDVTEESPINEEDIETVAEKANVNFEKAKEALENSNGDLAEAILSLKEN